MDRIEVSTVFGTLYAEKRGDPTYPGIYIGLDGGYRRDIPDTALALAECVPDTPVKGGHSLRLLVWNSDDENFTDDFTFFKEAPAKGDTHEEMWAKYLQYLRDWANAKRDPGFIGCCPVSYVEWLVSERREKDGKNNE